MVERRGEERREGRRNWWRGVGIEGRKEEGEERCSYEGRDEAKGRRRDGGVEGRIEGWRVKG